MVGHNGFSVFHGIVEVLLLLLPVVEHGELLVLLLPQRRRRVEHGKAAQRHDR
jgi:hypothetical protein